MADGMHHDSSHNATALLRELAAAHGVGTSYWGWDGVERSVADSTLHGVLAALGVPAGGPDEMERSLAEARLAPWRRMLPPVVVAREGQELRVSVHVPHGSAVSVWITAEDGSTYEAPQRDNWDAPVDVDGVLTGRATFAVPDHLPLGWHTLKANNDGTVVQCPLVVTPLTLDSTERLGGGGTGA
jgi:4-alpha-glucanotransferase